MVRTRKLKARRHSVGLILTLILSGAATTAV